MGAHVRDRQKRTWRSYYLGLDAWDGSLFHFRDSDDGCETMSAFGLHDNVAEASGSTGLRAMPAGQAKSKADA